MDLTNFKYMQFGESTEHMIKGLRYICGSGWHQPLVVGVIAIFFLRFEIDLYTPPSAVGPSHFPLDINGIPFGHHDHRLKRVLSWNERDQG